LSQKALFLDRDGVINVDTGYVHTITDFHFISGIFNICQKAIFKDYLIIVVTNQAGIGRGLYTLNDFNFLTEWMCETFLANNIFITKVYYSPFHPVYGLGDYKRNDEMRKPRPGMINKAKVEYGLDLWDSVLIGDSYTDIQAGQSAGVRTNILFDEQNEAELEFTGTYHIVKKLQRAESLL
jgi:D-glycero-D-manno-heptose 1,7-bisphosphate phosphatase